MADYIDWPGKSGKLYRYWFVQSVSANGLSATGGNYLFVKKLQTNTLVPVYIGQADDLSKRLPSHERWGEAARSGASFIMAHTTPAGEGARLAEERDLIEKWDPLLNTHFRRAS